MSKQKRGGVLDPAFALPVGPVVCAVAKDEKRCRDARRRRSRIEGARVLWWDDVAPSTVEEDRRRKLAGASERRRRCKRRESGDCSETAPDLGGRQRDPRTEGPADRADMSIAGMEMERRICGDSRPCCEQLLRTRPNAAPSFVPEGWRLVEVIDVKRCNPVTREVSRERVVKRAEATAAVQNDHRAAGRRAATLRADRGALPASEVIPNATGTEPGERMRRCPGSSNSEQQHDAYDSRDSHHV